MNQVKCKLSKEQLLSKGFRFSKALSDDENEVYTYKFPVFKYKKMVILECELQAVVGDDKIDINVYDYTTIQITNMLHFIVVNMVITIKC